LKNQENKKKPSVFFLIPSPLGELPSQRFRFEHYLPLLEERGIRFRVAPYFTLRGNRILYNHGKSAAKAGVILQGFCMRLRDSFRLLSYDFVYIHREAAPLGPPFFEWIVARLFRKKVIYDFDDSIWLPLMSEYNKKFKAVKFFSKVGDICGWSYRVSVGNAFLKEYVELFNKNVVVVPTVVNTEEGHERLQDQDTPHPAVGWTGSFSTLGYLDMVLPVLQELQEEIPFTFYVIADKDPQLPLKYYQFTRWKRESETEDLLNFHIGLMPLTDDLYSRGKCGFKAIQYMSLGMPALVSPVGVNTDIVCDGKDGFICDDKEEWKMRLKQLLTDAGLRKKIGLSAREKIEKNYSVKVTEERFLSLFVLNDE
jgi:glycosyltransferase involved in cell wall biosynthesis